MHLERKETSRWGAERRRADLPPQAFETEVGLFIQTEQTPNPSTLKFLPGRVVMDKGTMDFAGPEAAQS